MSDVAIEDKHQRKLELRREATRRRKELRRRMTNDEIALLNAQVALSRIKMVLTDWTYDEWGNYSRVLYREE